MSSMSQNSDLNPGPEHSRPWLQALYQAKRERTVSLVKAAVDRLVQEGQSVTVAAVCRVSRELDPEGKGIGEAGVLNNPEAHAYYRAHRTSYQVRRGRPTAGRRIQPVPDEPPHVDPNRDVERVRRRYRQLSRAALADRLVAAEQAYANTQQELARCQFALAEALQRLQEAAHGQGTARSRPTNFMQ